MRGNKRDSKALRLPLVLCGSTLAVMYVFGEAHLVIGDHGGRVEQRRTNLRVILKRLTEKRVPYLT